MLVRMRRNWVTHTLVMGIQLPYNPGIVFLDIYPREMKSYVHTKTCTQVYKTTLFLQPKIINNSDVFQCMTGNNL